MSKDWPSIIDGLRALIAKVGPMWPDSTKLAGFASNGPYSCANCEYLNQTGNRCNQEVMMADPEVQHDEKGLAIITDAPHQCCEFVEPLKKLTQIEPQGDKLLALFVRHGQTEANKEKLFRGPMNFPLDSVGRQQGLDVRRFLAGYLGDKPLGASYRSSKNRTGEMADITIGPGKTKVIKNFDALNVGNYAGQHKTPENMKAIMHYQKNPDEKIPGGERINDFRARTNPEIKMVISEGEKTGRPTISFVHSSTIHQVSHLLHGDHNLVKVTPGGVVGVFKRPSGSLYAKALLHESSNQADKHMMS
jgi:broad specificity phosphatase PhoE